MWEREKCKEVLFQSVNKHVLKILLNLAAPPSLVLLIFSILKAAFSDLFCLCSCSLSLFHSRQKTARHVNCHYFNGAKFLKCTQWCSMASTFYLKGDLIHWLYMTIVIFCPFDKKSRIGRLQYCNLRLSRGFGFAVVLVPMDEQVDNFRLSRSQLSFCLKMSRTSNRPIGESVWTFSGMLDQHKELISQRKYRKCIILQWNEYGCCGGGEVLHLF